MTSPRPDRFGGGSKCSHWLSWDAPVPDIRLIGSTALLLCISLAFALLISSWTGDRFIDLVLAYSPGGVAEMNLIALSLGIEVPFVVLHHLVRVFLVVAGSAAVFRMTKEDRKRTTMLLNG